MDISNIKAPSFSDIVQGGIKGTMRSIQYTKAHHGKASPYSVLFGPLGGLMISDKDLQPEKTPPMSTAKKILPQNPIVGPPLPQGFDWHWPWSK